MFLILGLALALHRIGLGILRSAALLWLDAPPLHGQGAKDHAGAKGRGQDENSGQSIAVRGDDSAKLARGYDAAKSSGTGVDDGLNVEASASGKAVDELAGKDVLADREENGAAELLHEEHQGHAKRDIGARQDILGGQVGGLEAGSDAETIYHLVANPLVATGTRRESREHATADGAEKRG